jgi:hypothetical protein
MDLIARFTCFDFYGGVVAGMGINILAALLITDVNSTSLDPVRALYVAMGSIVAGAFISIGRATVGEIRNNAHPIGGGVDYYARLEFACGLKGHIAISLFLIGILTSVVLVVFLICSMDYLISVQQQCTVP